MGNLLRNDIGKRVRMADLRTATVMEGKLLDIEGTKCVVQTDDGRKWRSDVGFVSLVEGDEA